MEQVTLNCFGLRETRAKGLRITPGTPFDNRTAEVQKVLQELLQVEGARGGAHQRHHIARESRLQLCVLVQPIQHNLCPSPSPRSHSSIPPKPIHTVSSQQYQDHQPSYHQPCLEADQRVGFAHGMLDLFMPLRNVSSVHAIAPTAKALIVIHVSTLLLLR